MFGKNQMAKIDNPLRSELASLIDQRRAAEREAAAARTAVARADAAVEAAQAKHEAAKIALVSWRAQAAARLTEHVTTGAHSDDPPPSARDARAAEADAAVALAVAKTVQGSATATLDDCEGELRRCQRKVAAATGPIIATAVNRLIAEAEATRDALAGQLALLAWLETTVLEPDSPERGKLRFARAALTSPGAPRPPTSHPIVEAWKSTREKLQVDADAALPK